MNIAIPKIYVGDKLTEGEASFIAFMTMVGDDNGFDYFYSMNSGDVKKILGSRYGQATHQSEKLNNIRKYFHIIALDNHNWSFAWKEFDPKRFHNRKMNIAAKPMVKHGFYNIKTKRAIQIWCYLLGMYRGSKDLVTDGSNTKHLYFKDSTVSLKRLEHENFKVESSEFTNPNEIL